MRLAVIVDVLPRTFAALAASGSALGLGVSPKVPLRRLYGTLCVPLMSVCAGFGCNGRVADTMGCGWACISPVPDEAQRPVARQGVVKRQQARIRNFA